MLEKRNIELSDMNEYLLKQTQEIDKIKHHLTNNIEKEKVKMTSKKSSKQCVYLRYFIKNSREYLCFIYFRFLRLSQKKFHGDGVDESFNQVARKIVGRRSKHHFIHPYTSDISLSTVSNFFYYIKLLEPVLFFILCNCIIIAISAVQ